MIQLDERFGDGMVFQRGKPIAICGIAVQEAEITIAFCGSVCRLNNVNGAWKAVLPAISRYCGPVKLTVSTREKEIILSDLYVGEVWLAAGQSNMQMRLREDDGWPSEDSLRDYPLIRFYRPMPPVNLQDYDGLGWVRCLRGIRGKLSAVAYYFAKELQEQLACAVGIVDCSMGSTSAACWMSEDALQRCSAARSVKVDEHNEYPPGALFQGMLRSVLPCAFRGVIYYQGESDVNNRHVYHELLQALIADWRKHLEDETLPLIQVQLPRFAFGGNPDGSEWALLRQKQLDVTHSMDSVYLATAFNSGEEDNIHPPHKQEAGHRLALIAQSVAYGLPVPCFSPTLKQWKIVGNTVLLTFDHVYDGLQMEEGNGASPMEICGEDAVYFSADCSLQGDCIRLSSPNVPCPVHVRYVYQNYGDIRICNSANIPVTPFCM